MNMQKKTDAEAGQAGASSPSGSPAAPYEGALIQAFGKLHSEVLIFLLAYMILLIGMAVFGGGIPAGLRNLVYIIPILGVVAYSWQRGRSLAGREAPRGVSVSVGVAKDSAYVGGVRGDRAGKGPVDVHAGLAAGGAQVVGVDNPPSANTAARDAPAASDEEVLTLFRRLDEEGRKKVLAHCLDLYARQIRGKG